MDIEGVCHFCLLMKCDVNCQFISRKNKMYPEYENIENIVRMLKITSLLYFNQFLYLTFCSTSRYLTFVKFSHFSKYWPFYRKRDPKTIEFLEYDDKQTFSEYPFCKFRIKMRCVLCRNQSVDTLYFLYKIVT